MKKSTVKHMAFTGTILFFCLSLILLTWAAIAASNPSTEDLEDYPAALQSLRRPGELTLALFPNEIPASAEDAQFFYSSDLGGATLCLKYKTEPQALEACQRAAAQKAVWSGAPTQKDATSEGVYAESLAVFDYAENGFPPDLTVYVTHQEPYREADWNHGEIALVGVSVERCEVLFLFQDW